MNIENQIEELRSDIKQIMEHMGLESNFISEEEKTRLYYEDLRTRTDERARIIAELANSK